MLKKLLVACVGVAVLVVAGAAFAGVPCTGTSSVSVTVGHLGISSCSNTAGAFCPAGDQDTAKVAIVIADCYGNLLAGREVEIAPVLVGGNDFFFCPCDDQDSVTTDALGEASTTFLCFGGCGTLVFRATVEGVEILGNPINVANFDNNNSQPTPSPADGVVGLPDFSKFSNHFGGTNACSDYDCSGAVGLPDFAKFSAHFGDDCDDCCP
jgi:hypothetical protein